MTKQKMDLRIKSSLSQRGWQDVVRIFKKRGVPLGALKVAEVGSGSGTMAMTFGLMGASVTLIDFNEKALESSRKTCEMYGCAADFFKNDCLAAPPEEFINKFDLVISVGLAEHFSGDNRKKCVEYHRKLAKENGVVFITVPNRLSLSYWLIRAIRTLTGTWVIDVEIPFSGPELTRTARAAGFADAYTIGYTGMWNDFIGGIYGLAYAVLDCLPKKLAAFLKGRRTDMKNSQPSQEQKGGDIATYCRQMAALAEGRAPAGAISKIFGRYCSDIVLIAFK